MYETIKQAGYIYLGYDRPNREHALLNKETKVIERWVANKNHASYGLIYKNTHLEFVRSTK